MSDSQPTDDESETRNPAQTVIPKVDTDWDFPIPFTGRRVKPEQLFLLTPGILGLIGGFAMILFEVYALAAVFFAMFAANALLAAWIAAQTKWHARPREQLGRWFEKRSTGKTLPWGHSEATENVAEAHGIRRIDSDGVTETTDDRLVGFYRTEGMNTNEQTIRSDDELAKSLGKAFNERAHDPDAPPISFYSSTFDFQLDEIAEVYRSVVFDDAGQCHDDLLTEKLVDEYFLDIADFITGGPEYGPENTSGLQDDWRSRHWRHYIVAQATTDDLEDLDDSSSWLWSWSDFLHPFRSADEHWETRRKEMKRVLYRRLVDPNGETGIGPAIDQVAWLNGHLVSQEEAALLSLDYWSGDDLETILNRLDDSDSRTVGSRTGMANTPLLDVLSSVSDTLQSIPSYLYEDDEPTPEEHHYQQQPDREVPSDETAAARLLAPGIFDVTNDFVKVGTQYARTYWVYEWPLNPASLFFRKLYTMNDIDVDIKVYFDAEDTDGATWALTKYLPSIDAEGDQQLRENEQNAKDLVDVYKAYAKLLDLLKNTQEEAWRMSAYITVRTDRESAIDELEQSVRGYEELDAAALQSLEDRSSKVINKAAQSPVKTYLHESQDWHRDTFQAAAPTGRDYFAERLSGRDLSDIIQRRPADNERTHLVAGAMIGALFPPCSGTIQEPDAVRWGTNEQNGSIVSPDPFDRGSTPHLGLTGQSRAGKTIFLQSFLGPWFNADPDRTLIVFDSQAGFHALTELCGGERYIVDGSRGFNFLDIQPTPDWLREAVGDEIDPLGQKIEEVTAFVSGLVKSQGGDPDAHLPTIRQGARNTFHEAGITRDLDTHSRKSPIPADYLREIENLLDVSAGEFWKDKRVQGLQEKSATKLLHRLSSFQPGGRHHYLLYQDESSIVDPSMRMAYLDAQNLQEQNDIEKSTLMMGHLGAISQKIKQSPGETIACFDEAHMLMHSPAAVSWMEKAAREWARYDAGMWLASQNPREFLSRASRSDEDMGLNTENRRKTTADQWSMYLSFNTPRVDKDLLPSAVSDKTESMNPAAADTVDGNLVPGKRGKGYSQALATLDDRHGWWKLRVQISEFEKIAYSYDPKRHGEFYSYMERNWPGFSDGELTDLLAEQEALDARESLVDDDSIATAVRDVSGIGAVYSSRLTSVGVETVFDLRQAAPSWLASVTQANESDVKQWQVNAEDMIADMPPDQTQPITARYQQQRQAATDGGRSE